MKAANSVQHVLMLHNLSVGQSHQVPPNSIRCVQNRRYSMSGNLNGK